MATGSMGPTGTTGPRPCPTLSWKEEELSGLGEGTEEIKNINNLAKLKSDYCANNPAQMSPCGLLVLVSNLFSPHCSLPR